MKAPNGQTHQVIFIPLTLLNVMTHSHDDLQEAITALGNLLKSVHSLAKSDRNHFQILVAEVLQIANGMTKTDPQSHSGASQSKKGLSALYAYCFGRIAEKEFRVNFPFLVRTFTSRRAITTFRSVNPFLTLNEIQDIFEITALAMSAIVRVGLLSRVATHIQKLLGALHRIDSSSSSSPSFVTIDLLQASIASQLLTSRYYVKGYFQENPSGGTPPIYNENENKKEMDGGKEKELGGLQLEGGKENVKEKDRDEDMFLIEFDPTYLVFEFSENLLLRREQILVLERFLQSKRDSRSLVSQMIMGSGKTTVVSPLLLLMLAIRRELVIQVSFFSN